MYKSQYLKGSYSSKRALFKALQNNASSIFTLKKAQLKESDAIAISINKTGAEKAEKLEGIDVGSTIYPVINSCNILDSHDDVHIPGLWNKSVQEQQGKTYYTADHLLSINSVIAHPEDVELMLNSVSWRDLNVDVDGETECLIFGVTLRESTNPRYLAQVKDGINFQQSIRMRYVRLALCINDDDPDFRDSKKNWDLYFPGVVNKGDAWEQGYFFAILEAKIEKEGSAVLFGSNHATTILADLNNTSPLKSTNTEPPRRTRLAEAKRLLTLT